MRPVLYRFPQPTVRRIVIRTLRPILERVVFLRRHGERRGFYPGKIGLTLSASRFCKTKTTLLRDAINGATMHIDIRRTGVALIPCNRSLSLM
jgi:hypothetical protein